MSLPQPLVRADIEAYCLAHTQPGSALSEQLATFTQAEVPMAQMLSGRVEARLLQMLIRLSGASRVLEIGTFTGYSALMMAEALPEQAEIITVDIDPVTNALARQYFAQSPHGHKITSLLTPALPLLASLTGPFQLIFLDADKEQYPAYYEACLTLLDERGVLVIDNTLWYGKVLAPVAASDLAIAQLNDLINSDPRVQNVQLSVRDGIQLVMKKPAVV